VGAPQLPGPYAHLLRRMDNALILAEDLDENAVQSLIPVALEDLFPEPCEKLRISNEDIRARYTQEFMKRKDTIFQEITKGEDHLRRILREAVVEDVIKLFPYVHRWYHRRNNDNMSACCRSLGRDDLSASVEDSADQNGSQEATGRAFLYLVRNVSHGFYRRDADLRSRIIVPRFSDYLSETFR
jgi:hypothetical protein